MGKGEMTRQSILEHAFRRASKLGLEGLTIGGLAEDTGLSKSGLFAHFESKEALQLAAIEYAAERFVDRVIRPALQAPRGEARLRALMQHWLHWNETDAREGGCFFAAASFEVDDRPGVIRDRIAEMQRSWLGVMAKVAATGVESGELRQDLDTEQLAHELHGIMLATQHASRLLRDAKATTRAWRSFEALLAHARATARPRGRRSTAA